MDGPLPIPRNHWKECALLTASPDRTLTPAPDVTTRRLGLRVVAAILWAAFLCLGSGLIFPRLNPLDKVATRGAKDENGETLTIQSFANLRATTGMFGAGYLEMLARQITADLQQTRDSLKLGQSKDLVSKGISFGTLARRRDGLWDTSKVVGLPQLSLLTATSADPPSLIIRPWHQAGNVVSLREFTNNSLNQHHGIQTTERFGVDTDPDGDGVKNEMTRADVTALTAYQAALAVPGRLIPNDPDIEHAIWNGEKLFDKIGCASCHISKLPIDKRGWIYEEPSPYNPPTNLRRGDAALLRFDLTNDRLPQPAFATRRERGRALDSSLHRFQTTRHNDRTGRSCIRASRYERRNLVCEVRQRK